RVLTGILNSDPVVVESPDGGAPSASYRAYKARMADRPTMLLQATHDGQLHAFYTGKHASPDNKIQKRTSESPTSAGDLTSTTGSAKDQREAWSYIPQMLHDRLANFEDKKPKLMDGATTVADTRLCYDKAGYNNNFNACKIHCSKESSTDPSSYKCESSDFTSQTCVPKDMRFRTVAVQGLGQAGAGYVALDVSRPGGPDPKNQGGDYNIERPDPVPLWEFTPEWATAQVEQLSTTNPDVAGSSISTSPLANCNGWAGGCPVNGPGSALQPG
ncbi:MAG: hypothetical protein ABEN55_14795, partial [Bradymonadaceae bacterium]